MSTPYLQIGLGILGIPLVFTMDRAVFLSFQRSWGRAGKIARVSFVVAVFVLFLAWFAIPIVVLARLQDGDVDVDTSSRARALAEAISDGMNWTAAVFLSALIALPTWIVSSWKARKSAPPPTA